MGHLASTGVEHGLIGPREVPRLWERHVLNCALIADLIPAGARVADIGSGAGLPGLAVAIRRPDLEITLVEPLLRRVVWLERVTRDLVLPNVSIRRGRAQEFSSAESWDMTTARAVAPLPRLVDWCLPLLQPGGTLLAIKGRQAQAEVDSLANQSAWQDLRSAEVVTLGAGLVSELTTVVRVIRG